MEDTPQYMRISELSEASGVPKPSIRYYIQTGILANPIKVKAASAYYTAEHLERLKLIKVMRGAKNPSLSLLKKMINSVHAIEGKGEATYPDVSQIVRDKITDASIPLFRKKGYERVTITDIAEAARISRNTFYENYKNKQQLMIACLTRIFLEWRKKAIPSEDSTPTVDLIKKMWQISYKSFPEWIDMLNIFRSSATKYPDIFAEKLEQSLSNRIRPTANDIEKGVKRGEIRQVDSELAGVMIAGMVEYVSYYMLRGKFDQQIETINKTVDILFDGLKVQSSDNRSEGVLQN